MYKSLSSLNENPIFFIVGRGRSGSTLLRSIFDAHPNVMIPLESRFVQFLFYKYSTHKKWTKDAAMQVIPDLKNSFEPLTIDKENFWKQLDNLDESSLSFTNLCKLIYLNTYTEFPKEEIAIIGDKNPRYTFFIPTLIKLFPQAKFIHLVRDYRDNIVSVQRSAKAINESGNIPYIVGRWRLYNNYIQRYQQKFPEKFYTLRFEDLVVEPEKEMQHICDFLKLNFNPEMLKYDKKIESYYKDDGFKTLHKSLKKPFDVSKIGEWKRKLPKNKVIRAEILAGSFPEGIWLHA